MQTGNKQGMHTGKITWTNSVSFSLPSTHHQRVQLCPCEATQANEAVDHPPALSHGSELSPETLEDYFEVGMRAKERWHPRFRTRQMMFNACNRLSILIILCINSFLMVQCLLIDVLLIYLCWFLLHWTRKSGACCLEANYRLLVSDFSGS